MSDLSIKQYVFRRGAAKRIPVSGTFELTSRCNLNCKMCYVHLSPEEQSKIGDELTTAEWITLGKDAVDEGMLYLLLTGGEPLLRQDFEEIYTSLIKMGLFMTINTNGTLLTSEILKCLKKYRPEKVNITLYGMSECTYGALCGNAHGFCDAVQAIQKLKEAGVRVNLNTTFTRYNIDDMKDIVAFAKKMEIPIRMSSYIFPPVRSPHNTEEVNLSAEELGKASAQFDLLTMNKEQIEKRKEYIRSCIRKKVNGNEKMESKISSCLAGRGAFWISWDGKMYPCGMLSEYVQDIRYYTFHEAWKNTCESIKQLLLPPECSVCKYQPLCASCAAVSQTMYSTSNIVVQEMCVKTKTYAETFLNPYTSE